MGIFHKYPEIVTLDKRPEILAVKEVIAAEKLHGTNFRLLFSETMGSISDVSFGGRNELFGIDDKGKFYGGRPIKWFKERPAMLQKMWDFFKERGYRNVIIYGEFCGAGIQKGVRYVLENEIVFRAIDIRIGENLVTYDLFVEICDAVDLIGAPEVWRGEPSIEAFDALLEKPSLEGLRGGIKDESNIMEGVVIRSNPLLRNVFGDWLIIKHKAERFSEAARQDIRKGRHDLTSVDKFARTYVTRGRAINAIGRLRDRGETLANAMEDMRLLIPVIIEDLHKEQEAEWRSLILQGFSDRQIGNMVNKILALIYQSILSEAAVEKK
jgi:Rnl2 family RNA ligase